MCADEYPTATEKVKIIFHLNQLDDAEKRRGWVAITHPLVAEGLKLKTSNLECRLATGALNEIMQNYVKRGREVAT